MHPNESKDQPHQAGERDEWRSASVTRPIPRSRCFAGYHHCGVLALVLANCVHKLFHPHRVCCKYNNFAIKFMHQLYNETLIDQERLICIAYIQRSDINSFR